MDTSRICTDTRFLTLLGKPLEQSFAAGMQNRVFGELDMNYVYFYTETETAGLAEIVAGLRRMPFAGFAVTKPNKVAIMELLDELDPLCADIGACNTVVIRPGGTLKGYNTDAMGFLAALEGETAFQIPDSRVFCLGAGGAGRAVTAALCAHGAACIHIADMDPEAGGALARQLSSRYGVQACCHFPGDFSEIDGCSLVVNASGVGMGATAGISPLPAARMNSRTLYYDCCYNPEKTRFLLDAERSGARICNGLGMSLYQAAEQIRLWTGVTPPLMVMRRALEAARAERVREIGS